MIINENCKIARIRSIKRKHKFLYHENINNKKNELENTQINIFNHFSTTFNLVLLGHFPLN